jgi:hypothetical protein
VTPRQRAWAGASRREARGGSTLAAGLFGLLAMPSQAERGHSHLEHSTGFRTAEGRRGFRCAIDRTVLKWIDPEEPS